MWHCLSIGSGFCHQVLLVITSFYVKYIAGVLSAQGASLLMFHTPKPQICAAVGAFSVALLHWQHHASMVTTDGKSRSWLKAG
jgi:hypothetical protein